MKGILFVIVMLLLACFFAIIYAPLKEKDIQDRVDAATTTLLEENAQLKADKVTLENENDLLRKLLENIRKSQEKEDSSGMKA